MVTPPIQAPSALPRLNAAMLAPEARVGACAAYRITRLCSPGTVPKPKPPISDQQTMVDRARGEPGEEREHDDERGDEAEQGAVDRAVGERRPTQLPTKSPAPNSTSSHGTAPESKPLTSVSV